MPSPGALPVSFSRLCKWPLAKRPLNDPTCMVTCLARTPLIHPGLTFLHLYISIPSKLRESMLRAPIMAAPHCSRQPVCHTSRPSSHPNASVSSQLCPEPRAFLLCPYSLNLPPPLGPYCSAFQNFHSFEHIYLTPPHPSRMLLPPPGSPPRTLLRW